MCNTSCTRRDLVKLAGASALLIAGPAMPVPAEASKIRLKGGNL